MPERICKTAHVYAGRQVEVGQQFQVDQADVELMLATGRIKREEGDAVPGHVAAHMAANWPDGYATRDMIAARGRRYQRKAA